MSSLVIYCADIGSVANNNFGWARLNCVEAPTSEVGQDISDFADKIADDLNSNHPVALGFECPLFIPVSDDPELLTAARKGEGNRAWSARAGAGSLVPGLSETVWILIRIQQKILSDIPIHLRWSPFQRSNAGLFLWEAFITGKSKTDTHTGDAKLAVNQFYSYLHDPEAHNAITCSNPRSLIGAALLQSGLTDDLSLLNKPCLVIRGQDEPLPESKQRRSVMGEGDSNSNGQVLVRKTTQPSPNFSGQNIWEMECKDCKHRYGANGCDVHHRKCPNCQGGKDGFDVTL
jgi:hypothetical protein